MTPKKLGFPSVCTSSSLPPGKVGTRDTMMGWQVSWESCIEHRSVWTRKQFSSSGPGTATGPTLALQATSSAVTTDAKSFGLHRHSYVHSGSPELRMLLWNVPLYHTEPPLRLRTPGHADVSQVSVHMLRYVKGGMLMHSWGDSEDRLWAKGCRG